MLGRYLQRVPKRHYCDFRVYHHTAQVYLERGDIYADYTPEGITPFKYSPFFALLVSPLGLLPIKPAAAVFFLINFLATVALFWLALKLSGEGFSWRAKTVICLLAVALTGRFIILVWDSGQVPIMITGLVLASLYFFSKGKDVPAAGLLAASILFKYLPALFIPYFLARRRFKAAGLTALFVCAWLLLPMLYSGFSRNLEYLSSWLPSIVSTSLDQLSYYDFKNQSIFSLALRTAYATPYGMNIFNLGFRAALWLGYALALGLYLLALLPGKHKHERIDFALLVAFIPLFNPNAWMVNFVSLAFPCVILLAYLRKERLKDIFVIVCLAASFLLILFSSESLVGNRLENLFSAASFITFSALFMVAALAKLKFAPAARGII